MERQRPQSDRSQCGPLLVLALLIVATAGFRCAEPPSPPPQTFTSYPHATDRYTTLLRQLLTTDDPVAVQQEITCEEMRIFDVVGEEMPYRIQAARARAFGPEDATALRKVENELTGRVFEFSSPKCDSLKARANQIDPPERWNRPDTVP